MQTPVCTVTDSQARNPQKEPEKHFKVNSCNKSYQTHKSAPFQSPQAGGNIRTQRTGTLLNTHASLKQPCRFSLQLILHSSRIPKFWTPRKTRNVRKKTTEEERKGRSAYFTFSQPIMAHWSGGGDCGDYEYYENYQKKEKETKHLSFVWSLEMSLTYLDETGG